MQGQLQPHRISQTARLNVEAEKGQVTNRQTLRVKATPSALRIQKQWESDLGGWGDRDRHCGIIHFHSDCTTQTAGLPLRMDRTVWLARVTFTIKTSPSWGWTKRQHRFWWNEEKWQFVPGSNWQQNAHKRKLRFSQHLHVCAQVVKKLKNDLISNKTRCTQAQGLSFQLKRGVLRRRTSVRLQRESEWEMAKFMSALWDDVITFRWQGRRALYSVYKDHSEYWGQDCHYKPQCLKLWFQIWHYIYNTESNRHSNVTALFWIYRDTLRNHLSVCLFTLLETPLMTNVVCFLLSLHTDSFVFPQCALT